MLRASCPAPPGQGLTRGTAVLAGLPKKTTCCILVSRGCTEGTRLLLSLAVKEKAAALELLLSFPNIFSCPGRRHLLLLSLDGVLGIHSHGRW